MTPNEAASITIQGFPLDVSINDTDMEPGTYEGSVILQRLDRLPRKIPTQELRNRTEIPVTLVVNAPAGAAPSISEGALVNAADLSSNLGLGALLTLFGENFASNSAAVRALPYPDSLSGVTVELDGEAVPLQFVSENQINLQVPIFANFFEPIPVRVLRDFVPSQTIMVQLEIAAPGLFRDPSSGVAVAVRAVDGSLVSAENPALPDEVLTFYGTGIGLTLEQPPDGAAASTQVLSEALFPVEATIGGRPALVEFAGLAPGFVGLAQLNVRVPADVLPGESAVVVDVLGVESVPAPLPIGAR